MSGKLILFTILGLVFVVLGSTFAEAQDLQPIQLVKPQTEGGKPLMQALNERSSAREYSDVKLPPQVLSNLLWAASGINRQESGKRTAPTASNRQEMDIYVALPEALYVYEAKTHSLQPVLAKDIRATTGRQEYVGQAALNLVYVADYAKMGGNEEAGKILNSGAATGCIAQNVYLFCASEGLSTVIRGNIDKLVLAKEMNLREDQKITLAQTVGYPKKQ